MAAFIDGGRTVDRTNWSNTFISYYPFGGAIALALDLTLRDRSDGRVSLDDFMRAMWRSVRQAGRRPRRLRRSPLHDRRRGGDAGGGQRRSPRSRATSSRATSRGTRSPTTRACSARAGFTVRKRNAGRAWLGDLRLESRGGTRVAVAGGADLADLRRRHRPGRPAAADRRPAHRRPERRLPPALARTSLATSSRSCSSIAPAPRGPGRVTLGEDPHLEVVPAERAAR